MSTHDPSKSFSPHSMLLNNLIQKSKKCLAVVDPNMNMTLGDDICIDQILSTFGVDASFSFFSPKFIFTEIRRLSKPSTFCKTLQEMNKDGKMFYVARIDDIGQRKELE